MQRLKLLSSSLGTNSKNGLRFVSTVNNTLYDNHGRGHDYLRISLTERCNLRCRYCMPEEGIELTSREKSLTLVEMKRLSSIFVESCGIKKIRLTGGEPTVDKKLFPLLEHLNGLRDNGLRTIAMTTNGITLKKHCSLLKTSGLDAINISLDTLRAERFEQLTRRKGWNLAFKGIQLAIEANFETVKVNCVLMRGINDDEVLSFAALAEIYPIEVRFIEFMPFAGNKWNSNRMISYDEVLTVLQAKYRDLEYLPTGLNAVSKVYKSSSMIGTLGFITSMSRNFCSGCNRLRLTSDGNLKVCLFEKRETSLRDLIRNEASDAEVVKAISAALKHKKKQHSGMSHLQHETSRPMITIGARAYHSSSSGNFSHLNEKGEANMVDVGDKGSIKRVATAQGKIIVGSDVMARLYDKSLPKGDILSVSKVAGIMAAKRTSQLIPLCHQIPLDHVCVEIVPNKEEYSLVVTGTASAHYNTGVEMESLTAVTVTLLTIYDMCKSVNKSMIISEVKLLAKTKG